MNTFSRYVREISFESVCMIDYYEILQVSPHAEPEIIEAAYKRLALKYHPDTNPSPSTAQQMKWINQAYALLSDPEKRAQYDEERRAFVVAQRPASPVRPDAQTPARAPTPDRVPPRPKLRRLRACLSLLLVIALAAILLWAIRPFDLSPLLISLPPLPFQIVLPPITLPLPKM